MTITLNAMKITEIETPVCRQFVVGYGACEELADYRIEAPGIVGHFCRAHASPFIKGEVVLKTVLCHQCEGKVGPGEHTASHMDRSWIYCSESCRRAFENEPRPNQYGQAQQDRPGGIVFQDRASQSDLPGRL